jgi:hypothetical protein
MLTTPMLSTAVTTARPTLRKWFILESSFWGALITRRTIVVEVGTPQETIGGSETCIATCCKNLQETRVPPCRPPYPAGLATISRQGLR